jgi:hypothetical protein
MTPPWGYTATLEPGRFVTVLVPFVAGWDKWLREAAQLALERAIRAEGSHDV